MATWQDPEQLSAIALGPTSKETLADGSEIEAGVHLRWQMGQDMSFPRDGFDVFRREHLDQPPVCGYVFQAAGGGPSWNWTDDRYRPEVQHGGKAVLGNCDCNPKVTHAYVLPGEQEFTLDPGPPARTVEVYFDSDSKLPIYGFAYWRSPGGDVLVDEAQAEKMPQGDCLLLRLNADHIDYVILKGKDMQICLICILYVEPGLKQGWGAPLNAQRIYLPVDHPDYNAPYPDPIAEADQRLSPALPGDVRSRYRDGYENELYDIVHALVGHRPQQDYYFTETDELAGNQAATEIEWQGLSLLNLTAIDPNLARILGLFFVDTTAIPGELYDYLIVGYWGNEPHPGKRITFKDFLPGAYYTTGLDYEGITIETARPITAITQEFEGVDRPALEIDDTSIFSIPIWMQLPKGYQGIDLYLNNDAQVTITVYNGEQKVGSDIVVSPGENVVRIARGQPFNRLRLKSSGRMAMVEWILRKDPSAIGDVAYATFRHGLGQASPVPATKLKAISELPANSPTLANGLVEDFIAGVGLRWDDFAAGGGYLLSDAPVRFLVRRQYTRELLKRTGSRKPDEEIVLNSDSPAIVSRMEPTTTRPDGMPNKPHHYTDFVSKAGSYRYQVSGIDLFGRIGDWGSRKTIEILRTAAPPPPDNLHAKYLSRDDRYLSGAERATLGASHSGLSMDFVWSGLKRMQFPAMEDTPAEFRIYTQRGALNSLTGDIMQVVDQGSQSELHTDQDWSGAADDLAGEMVRSNGSFFAITGNTSGRLVLQVENLTNPREIPRAGSFTISYATDRSYWRDYGKTANWEVRETIVSATATPLVHGLITQTTNAYLVETDQPAPAAPYTNGALHCDGGEYTLVKDMSNDLLRVLVLPDAAEAITFPLINLAEGDAVEFQSFSSVNQTQSGSIVRVTPIVMVTTDQALTDQSGDLLPGVIVSDDVLFPVIDHVTGSECELYAVPVSVPSDSLTAFPAEGAAFTYYPGRQYSIFLPDYHLPVPAGAATAIAQVAVSSSDGVRYVDDDPAWANKGRLEWAGRPGNEGSASSAVQVIHAAAGAPPAPTPLTAGPDPIFAQPADYYGQARYTLSWNSVSDAAGYAIYRCSKSTFATYYKQFSGSTDDTIAQLSDAQVQDAVNDTAGMEAAFRRVNEFPVEDTQYTDSFDGRGSGFYIYRIRAIDAAANLGAWSDAFPPIHIYDVTSPATPVITGTSGGEETVKITWRANREADLAEYRLWRADTAEELADVRRLAPSAVLTPTPGVVAESHTETNLTGGQTVYFTLAAVDSSGNVSERTAVVHGRAVDTIAPQPPVWVDANWIFDATGSGIRLEWQVQEPDLTCTVYRRPFGGGVWRAVSPPLTLAAQAATPSYDFTFVDYAGASAHGVTSGADYDYYIAAEDQARNKSAGSTIQTVWH